MLTKFLHTWLFFSLIIFTFIIPPFQKPDEINHYFRAISVAKGEFFCSDRTTKNAYVLIPHNFYDLPNQMSANILRYKYAEKFPLHALFTTQNTDTHLIKVTGLCTLPSIGYLSMIPGIGIGLVSNNPLLALYLGRLFAGIFFLICLGIALKVIPQKYKLLIYLFGFIPMVMYQATTISYDSMQLSLFIIIFSLFLQYLTLTKITIKQLLIFLFLLALFTLSKSGYYPILLLFFAIPYKKITNKLSLYLLFTLLLCIPGIVVTVLSARVVFTPLVGHPMVNPPDQMNYLWHTPLAVIHVLFNSIQSYGDFYYQSMIAYFGWVDFHLNYFIYEGYTIIIAGCLYFLIKQNSVPLINKKQCVLLIGIIISTIVIIYLSQYLSWSPVGSPVVHGVQGRYFQILLPITIFTIVQIALLVGKRRFYIFLGIAFLTFLLLNLCFNIYNRYYNYKDIYLNEYPFTNIMENLSKSTITTIPIQTAYTFKLHNDQEDKTIDGFTMVFTTQKNASLPPYEYVIKDAACKITLRDGFFKMQALENNPNPSVYEEKFTSPVEKGRKTLCIIIKPAASLKHSGNLNLISLKNKVLFEPLYNK